MAKQISLVLPIGFSIRRFAEDHALPDVYPDIIVASSLENWSYNFDGGGLSMTGKVTDSGLEVLNLDFEGDASGQDYESLLKPLFLELKGLLLASSIWDDGTILKLAIENGKIEEKEVEL